MKKIFSIVGTRPEAIKMAPLASILNDDPEIDHSLVCSGQHQEMMYQVLDFFNLQADHDLKLMNQVQNMSELISRMVIDLTKISLEEKPDAFLVHGDTVTTMIASIVAFYSNIKVFHIEAGLRTGNLAMPWPEEGNRKIVSAISTHHFAPTINAKKNLLREGVNKNAISVVGNTVIDALYYSIAKIKNDDRRVQSIKQKLQQLNSTTFKIALTCHRRENHGANIDKIIAAVLNLAEIHRISFIIPVHPNPNVKNKIFSKLSDVDNVVLTHPLDYDEFVYVMNSVDLILTDSGGIQEEAPALEKPVLVLRDKTERPEALEAGTIKLTGTNTSNIINDVLLLKNNKHEYKKMASAINPYGDGTAAKQILNIIKKNNA